MNITVKECNLEYAQSLNEKYHIPLLSATIMAERGIKEEDVKYYLEDDIVYQHSPFTVDDVYSAIERIDEALDETEGREQEKIIIFGDRDVDGITATAIMYKCLKKLGAKYVSYRLPHGDEGYGLSDEITKEIIDGGYTLCITVDNGISAIDEIKTLEKNGVDVIVLDHHLPLENLPPAVAIFDPKVEGIGYPFSGLAGCAVAAKLGWALFFSRTPLFNSSVILLHAQPGNGTVRIDAVRMENLIETKRLSDEFLVGEKGSLYTSPLFEMLSSNTPIVVLDKDTELVLLKKAFGGGVDISLEDFRPTLEKVIPSTKGKTLFDLALRSRSARYSSGQVEIETLISLFRSASIYSFPTLTKEFEEIQVLEAIGTVADLMPLIDENRLIVKKGLKLLSQRPPQTLSYLLSKQNLIGKPLTVSNISFKIAPVLNASGRMGEPETALSLLLSTSYSEMEELTERLLSLNTERQKNEEVALESVSELASLSLGKTGGKFIVVESDTIQRGLTGSIASKLANESGVPAIVLATSDDVVFGSMRSKDPWNARDFLSIFSSCFEDFGGHKAAAGLRMFKEKKDEFLCLLYSYIETMDEREKESESIDVDAVVADDDLEKNVWETLKVFEPFGQESQRVLFYLPKARIREAYRVGNSGKYMRFSLECGQYVWPALWWEAENEDDYKPGREVSLVFSPEINWWKGNGREQMNIERIELL